jgi:hypothetical protein
MQARGMLVRRLRAAALAIAGSCFATTGVAAPSLQECFEGSDFIVNAALSRDAGVPAAQFLERLEGDFLLVRAFPSELRWFVHDDGDEALLLAATQRVYGQPLPPEMHRRQFLNACLERIAMIAPDSEALIAPGSR